jgi:hypothetical protein
LKGEQMTFKSKMMVGVLTMLAFFAMASSSFAQVSITLIPDPSAGEIQTNNNAQTASPGTSGAGILISGALIANSPLTTTTLRITYPSPITSSPATFTDAPSIPGADPIRIEGATGVFAGVSNPVLNTANSRIEIQMTAFPALSGGNTQSGSFRLVGVRIDANGKSGAQTATASLDSSANNYILQTTSVTVINAIGPGIGASAIGGRAINANSLVGLGNNGTATIFTNRTTPDVLASLLITEGFASAWRTPTQSSNNATAVPNGTQLRLTFNGVPTGVTLTLAANAGDATNNRTVAVSNTVITAANTTTTISFPGPSAPSLTAVDQIELQMTVSANATAAVTTPGTITVTATMAPIGEALNNTNPAKLGLPQLGASGAYPTFTQADVGPVTVVNIVAASTTMLIPLAEKVGPFDTGIAVANTNNDPFGAGGGGATPSAGTLRFDFFPSTATGAGTACFLQTSATARPGVGIASDGTVPSGATYLALLSQLLPASNCAAGDFFGYIFITANFLNAHGQATISDFRTYSLATNVLVLPPPSTSPRTQPAGSAERLTF